MKKSLLVSFISLFMFGASCQLDQADYISNSENVRQLSNMTAALVKPVEAPTVPDDVEVSNTLGKEHGIFCSGVFVSPTRIVTAAHCVEYSRVLTIDTPFGQMTVEVDDPRSPVGRSVRVATFSIFLETRGRLTDYRIFRVTRYDEQTDLAVLDMERNQSLSPHGIARIANRNLRRGERSYVVGHPLGFGWSLTEGIISHPGRNIDGIWHVQSATDVFYGNSGGPLFDNNGQVVAIVSKMYGAPHMGMHIHHRHVREILARNWEPRPTPQTVGDMVRRRQERERHRRALPH